MSYKEKLKSPKWQKKRLEILQRDDFKCVYCNDDKTELQIHHLKYTKEPWDAPNEDLITLCKHCHTLVSKVKNTKIITVIKHNNNDDGAIITKEICNGKVFIGMYCLFNGNVDFGYGIYLDSEVFNSIDKLRR